MVNWLSGYNHEMTPRAASVKANGYYGHEPSPSASGMQMMSQPCSSRVLLVVDGLTIMLPGQIILCRLNICL